MTEPRLGLPNLGFGVGLRAVHFSHLLAADPPVVDWFEAITENFMDSRGRPRRVLDELACRYPVVLHGVSLNIGSTDPLDLDYLARVKALADGVGARWVSDHLCWTGVLGRNTHDLLPLPYDDDTLAHVVARIAAVQDALQRPLVLENPSSYATFRRSTMTEWEFLARMAEAADCGLLLDVNNVFVSCYNHGWDPDLYLSSVPAERVVQYHLAGHTNRGSHIVDTHDGPVIDDVWALFAKAWECVGPASTLIEWDARVPEFEVLAAEAARARRIAAGGEPEAAARADAIDAAVPHPAHHVAAAVE